VSAVVILSRAQNPSGCAAVLGCFARLRMTVAEGLDPGNDYSFI
jgi:hypothetical protein